MVTKLESKREFPWTDRIGGHEITFRLMTPEDRDNVVAFTQTLSKDDMMYLRMDISKPEVVDRWVDHIRRGLTVTILAIGDEEEIVGYCSLHCSELTWTRHIGEIRVFVVPSYRGIGLSTRLVNENFQIAREFNITRLAFNLSREQRHLQKLLEGLGFRVEALLTDWLIDREGQTHDLLIMSCDVED